MIVICTGCQARFRVADEKIGPRGAKVRCTRCKNVFVVQREAAPPGPAIDLDLTPGPARPAPGAPGVIPFPEVPRRSGGPAPDPFVAAGLDAFDALGAPDDPFAAPAVKQPTVKFPPTELGRSGAPGEEGASEQDPFALAAASFPAAGPTPTTSQNLPVTDLAQLLGDAAGADPESVQLSPEPDPLPPLPPPAPPPAAPRSSAFAAFDGDLTLEERHTGELAAPGFADPADVVAAEAAATSFSAAFPPGVWDDTSLPLGAPGGHSLALATDPTPVRAAAPAPAPVEEPPRPSSRARAQVAEPEPAPAANHPALASGSKLRGAGVNALALVALVVLALGIRAVLRGDAPPGPGALRPARLLQAFTGAPAPDAPYEVAEVRTGVYPQASGSSVVFVRGVVICRSAAPAGGVKVAAELVRDGQVLARGDVLAGVVPTPEDLWKAADRESLEALAAELGRRAPKRVAAGDRLGFLITLAEAPAELGGTSVRLQAGAAAR